MTVTNDFFNRLTGRWQNKVAGVWKDEFGWNLITQPELGKAGRDDFKVRIDQMRETIEFMPLAGPPARNIGVSGEAGHWKPTAYRVDIETPAGEGIHQEMGHFLLKVKEDGETAEPLKGQVIRQATIPRANAMMTTGILVPGSVSDAAVAAPLFYNGKPRSDDPLLQVKIDNAFAAAQATVTADGGPDLEKPLDWLETILRDDVEDIDWVFGFRGDGAPSQMANGQRVVNPVGIGNLFSDFWIAKRKTDAGIIDILQYAQVVDLIFNGMKWPHIAVNTLIKQP